MNLETISTDRIDEIKQHIKNIMSESLKEDIRELEMYLNTNMRDAVSSLNQLLTSLYQEAVELQKQGKIKKIQYIRITPRRALILEGNYSLNVRLYDADDYKSRVEVSREWNPKFIEKLFQRQLEKVTKRVTAQMFRITSREKQLLRFVFMDFFHFYVMTYLAVLEDVFVYVEPMMELETEEVVSVTFGNYMEEGVVIKAFSKSRGGEA